MATPRFVLCSFVLFILILIAGIVPNALAQDASTGAVRGTVTDASGALVAGATVALANAANGLTYSTVSDENGRFALELLPPGDYSGRAESNGLSPQVTPRLHVDLGATTEVQFKLSLAGSKETVTVSGAPPLVETLPSAVSSLIDERAIQDLPLNGRRFTDLALLAPGVTQDPRGMTSASNGDLAFGGIRGFQSSYLVDGADNNNGFFSQARGRYRAPYQFSNEVVQEFRVSSNTYGAELGRSGGAVVNVVTKSGSNMVHGTGFYFIRDSAFNAQPGFTDSKPADRQQQFGFTVGGPIRRNKMFFFGGLDQHVFHVPTLVRFDNGAAVVVPQKGQEPLYHGDYEESDKALVFAAADQLSNMAGDYRSALLGNTGFLKLDLALTPKNYLSARLNTSRYYGSNNVFFDPASPVTSFAITDNGEEDVATESGSLSLTSGLSWRLSSHLRAQFSRDLQSSTSNSNDVRTKIYDIIEGFGRSSILPRQTREHRLHLTETLSLEGGRHSWKFGGDALFTWIYNYFPSLFGGEYIFDDISVDPWTFAPMRYGMDITPLRAYAHGVPRYYIQNFGSAVNHPDTNEYAGFVQDTIRVTNRLALNLGARYDLQISSTRGFVANPLWADSGKIPTDTNNFSPRAGFAYSIGQDRPVVLRGGYGWFYTRIPQIYASSVASDNGFNGFNLILDNTDYYDQQIFPTYPNPLVNCPVNSSFCAPPTAPVGSLGFDISSFTSNFKTPRVQQGSLTIEKELAHRLAAAVSYLYVNGENLIRARDANLPEPLEVFYPVYDDAGTTFLNTYYNVPSFSTWQMTRSMTCPYPPCINPLERPIPSLGAVNVFETVASSVYHGLTVSVRRRMTDGVYFRLAYTYAHAIDDGQDALVAGRPSTVQNSYAAGAERASSVTDQRHRFVFSWVATPQPFHASHNLLARAFNDWKLSGVISVGSGRPLDARVFGDPNQDDNSANDRLPGYGRNAFVGPDYATADMRISRRLYLTDRIKVELMGEAFNLLNRDNKRVQVTDDGFQNTASDFVQGDKQIGINYFPAHYRNPQNFLQATSAYAPRQVQLALRFTF